jgi:hypothetical protein
MDATGVAKFRVLALRQALFTTLSQKVAELTIETVAPLTLRSSSLPAHGFRFALVILIVHQHRAFGLPSL